MAAGKSVYLFDGVAPGRVLKKMDFRYDVASVAVNSDSGKLVTGNAEDTWARVYDLHTDEELGISSPPPQLKRKRISADKPNRGPKRSPRPYLVRQLLARWQAIRNR